MNGSGRGSVAGRNSTRVGATLPQWKSRSLSPRAPRPRVSPTADQIKRAPKVLLHDHLDGGLRPETIVDLAAAVGYDGLPTTDPASSASGSRGRGLRLLVATWRPSRTPAPSCRPVRRCPGRRRLRRGPRRRRRGLRRGALRPRAAPGGRADPRRGRRGGAAGLRLGGASRDTANPGRHPAHRDAARRPLAGDRRAGQPLPRPGVVGFDIAGAEAGHPPTRHLDAFEYLERDNDHFTIHARRGLRAAVHLGGPAVLRRRPARPRRTDRGRHRGRRDGTVSSAAWRPTCATSGSRWRCARPPTCRPERRSTPRTRSVCSRLRFRVTVNTDNRLMSGTTLSQEFAHLVDAFGYTVDDMPGSPSTP